MQKQKEKEENIDRWTDTYTLHCNTVGTKNTNNNNNNNNNNCGRDA